MGILKYFIYDNVTDKITNSIKIEEFEYNSETLIWDFYKVLAEKYVDNDDKNYLTMLDINEVFKNLFFRVIGLDKDLEISGETGILTMEELFLGEINKLICIQTIYPMGGIVARYRNYKIVINSNEDIHRNLPHVHVWSPLGDDIFVDLKTFKYKGDFNSNQAKKKIIKYLKNKQKMLLSLYNSIVNHKIIEKVTIDIID